jgi:hypothetical protein
MKAILPVFVALLVGASPALAASEITCAQVPKAEAFLHKLKPGPNTEAAWRHLAAAKRANTDRACVEQLGAVNYFAKRSLAADRQASGEK